VTNSGFRPLYQFTTHASDDIFEISRRWRDQLLAESSSRFPLVGALGTRLGNRRHTAAKAETTGCGLMPRHAFDSPQRCRLR
jgi:hypothetical protein